MLLGPILDAPMDEWERTVQLNVLGLLYCAKAALPHLLEAAEREPRKTSDLVNVSSVAGRVCAWVAESITQPSTLSAHSASRYAKR